MKKDEVVAGAMRYLVAAVAPKLEDPLKQFRIGMVAGGLGRKRVDALASVLLDGFSDETGEVDLAALKASVMSGFAAAKTLRVAELGIVLEPSDAEELFASLGS
jgi:hypothetical protein